MGQLSEVAANPPASSVQNKLTPPSALPAPVNPTASDFGAALGSVPKEATVGFLESIFMNRTERAAKVASGDIQDNLGSSLLRGFIQPAVNVGQDIADLFTRRDKMKQQLDEVSRPHYTQQEAVAEFAKVDRLLKDGHITEEQANQAREDINSLSAPLLDQAKIDDARLKMGAAPNLKEILGDVGGTALAAGTFAGGEALGVVRGIRAMKAATTVAELGADISTATQVFNAAYKGTKLSNFLMRSIEGAGFMGAFSASQAAADNKSVFEIAQETGLGALAGAALPVAGSLFMKGFTRLASIPGKIGAMATERISDSELGQWFAQNIASKKAALRGSVSGVLERDFGDTGRMVISKIKTASTNVQLAAGRVMKILDETNKTAGLASDVAGREKAYQLGLQLEGHIPSTESSALKSGTITGRLGEQEAMMGKGLPKEVADASAFKVYRATFDDLAVEAQNRGVQERIPAREGQRSKWSPFTPMKDYMPHVIPDIKLLETKGRLRPWVIRRTLESGVFKTEAEAVNALDGYIEFVKKNGIGTSKENGWIKFLIKSGQAADTTEARALMQKQTENKVTTKLGTSIENSRAVNNPFYNPFPDEVAPLHVMDSLTRLENISQFGVRYAKAGGVGTPIIEKAVETVRATMGKEQADAFSQFVNVAMNQINTKDTLSQIANKVMAFHTLKLTWAQIMNLGQSVTGTILGADVRALAYGMGKAFTRAGQDVAAESGATLQSVFNEVVKASSGSSSFSDSWLRTTKFVFTEKFNRTVAANAGVDWATRNFTELMSNPKNTFARQALKELGVNVESAIQRGKLTDNDLLKAGYEFAGKTQFKGRPMDLPYFSSTAPGKVFFQFKNFAYQQARFVFHDSLIKEIQQKNFGRATRNLIVLGTVFPMTAEVLADVRSLFTQGRRPTKAWDRYLEDVALSGALGMAADFLTASKDNRGANLILGPTGGLVNDLINNADFWNDPKTAFKTLLRQTGVGSPFANLMSKPTKGSESTFETLKKL